VKWPEWSDIEPWSLRAGFAWFLGCAVGSWGAGTPVAGWQVWAGIALTVWVPIADLVIRLVRCGRPTHKIVKVFHHDGTECIPDDFDDLRYHEARPEDGHL